jgi:hypothetical protein
VRNDGSWVDVNAEGLLPFAVVFVACAVVVATAAAAAAVVVVAGVIAEDSCKRNGVVVGRAPMPFAGFGPPRATLLTGIAAVGACGVGDDSRGVAAATVATAVVSLGVVVAVDAAGALEGVSLSTVIKRPKSFNIVG